MIKRSLIVILVFLFITNTVYPETATIFKASSPPEEFNRAKKIYPK